MLIKAQLSQIAFVRICVTEQSKQFSDNILARSLGQLNRHLIKQFCVLIYHLDDVVEVGGELRHVDAERKQTVLILNQISDVVLSVCVFDLW